MLLKMSAILHCVRPAQASILHDSASSSNLQFRLHVSQIALPAVWYKLARRRERRKWGFYQTKRQEVYPRSQEK